MKPTPIFSRIQTGADCYDDVDKASYSGISIKTFIFFTITMLVAIATSTVMLLMINRAIDAKGTDEMATDWIVYSSIGAIVSVIVATIAGLVGRLSDKAAKVCIAIYSIAEGFALGFVTGIVEAAYPGYYIGTLAVFGTVVIFAVMLVLFATGIIRNGSFFRRFVLSVLISAIALSLFTTLFLVISGLFSRLSGSFLFLIFAVELLYLIYACLSLVFNFSEAQACVNGGCRKESEWSVALGLLITLAYIYIQLLRIIVLLLEIFGKKN